MFEPFFRYTYSEVCTVSSAGLCSCISSSNRNLLPSSLLGVCSRERRAVTVPCTVLLAFSADLYRDITLLMIWGGGDSFTFNS